MFGPIYIGIGIGIGGGKTVEDLFSAGRVLNGEWSCALRNNYAILASPLAHGPGVPKVNASY